MFSNIFFFYTTNECLWYNMIGGNMERIIFHIDVNNAFLSWSAIDLLNHGSKLDIRDSYAVIGGDEKSRHGIVLAKSMPAKKRGVKTGESLYQARKKVPALKMYPPNYLWYQKMSKSLFELLSKYTDDIEVASIDECYLDYGKVKKLYGDEIEFAYRLKEEVYNTLGFTVNIGIANNKLCAKMASDFSKPNKVHTLYQYEVEKKMYPLPIGDLFGVGRRTCEKLLKLGIHTIGDLAHADPKRLNPYLKNQSIDFIRRAQGYDDSPVVKNEGDPKGISNSITLPRDLNDLEEMNFIIHGIVENVTRSLRKQKKYASVVAVMIKDKFFKSYSHQRKLKNATDLSEEIYQVAKELLKECWNHEPVRLLGVRLDQLTEENHHQVSLFESVDDRERDTKLEHLIDAIQDKYGDRAIKKATLIDHPVKKKYLNH